MRGGAGVEVHRPAALRVAMAGSLESVSRGAVQSDKSPTALSMSAAT